jgi:hypothetical protein
MRRILTAAGNRGKTAIAVILTCLPILSRSTITDNVSFE